MELSIDDLMKLQQKSTDDALRIQELENLCREEHEARLHAEAEIVRLETLLAQKEMLYEKTDFENSMLKSYLFLSKDKVRHFYSYVKDMHLASFLHAFLIKSLPDAFHQAQYTTVEEIITMPEPTPTIGEYVVSKHVENEIHHVDEGGVGVENYYN